MTLAPNLTEIVFALGAGDRLVGVSDFSDFPPAARRLPSIGGVNPDLERIAALSPDLILATSEGNSPRIVSLLEKQGYPVLATRAPSLEGVLESILEISRRLGIPDRGESLVESLRKRESAVASRPTASRCPGVLVLVWPSPPQAAGKGTFADDLIRRAGGENCIPRSGWPVVSAEFLTRSSCRLVVFPAEASTAAVFARAFRQGALARMPAVQRGGLLGIDVAILTRPGPRAFDALEILSNRLARAVP